MADPPQHGSATDGNDDAWTGDVVHTVDGTAVPVRATSRRPRWSDLPPAVRAIVEQSAGSRVVAATSTGTGFTPGFASRLDLADGSRVFVKAASSVYDGWHGWTITGAYREEIRKLSMLPSGLPAPKLLWSHQGDVDGATWVVLGLQYVEGRPPRRPWRLAELQAVTDTLADIAPLMARPPARLQLGTFADDFGAWPEWLAEVRDRDGASPYLDAVAELAAESLERCAGSGMAHLDLRDDNILIDGDHRVWICDWNFPLLAAPWIDVVTIALAAYGDGLDADAELHRNPLTRDVPARSVDALLANLWLYFTTRMSHPVPEFSPHLRDHQRWYAEVTQRWLQARLAGPTRDSSAESRVPPT